MNAEIISIGSELLKGIVVNTNSSFLADKLTSMGHNVGWITTIADKNSEIEESLSNACKRADIVIVTGGLGPTADDVTKKVAADFFKSPIVFYPEIFDKIKKWMAQRNLKFHETSREQAMLPKDAELIENELGTARGMVFKKEGTLFFFFPGVPHEMKKMFEEGAVPVINREFGIPEASLAIIRTLGIAESHIAEKIEGFEDAFPEISLGFLPNPTGVRLYIYASGKDSAKRIHDAEDFIKERLKEKIYAFSDRTIEDVVAELLKNKKMTISIAESCTGGLVSHKLTNIPGSSAYLLMGVVVYSNQAKMSMLGVNENTLKTRGAVSKETALEMARNVRQKAGSDIGISTTGIAGPSGGTPEKPVGLVYTAISTEDFEECEEHFFGEDRLVNKERSCSAVLDMVRRYLE
ncbi:competence/damage-inducible protein A [bacterium]|nr:competence/damage-inducible protein A [bacterium]